MEESEQAKPERAPWGDFPKAITNGFIDDLSALPDYPAAKAGDAQSALRLVAGLMKKETIERVRVNFKPTPDTLITPVHAEESAGRNKIPSMIAQVLAANLGTLVDTDIVQTNRVRRTGSNANHRLAFSPTFAGVVQAGRTYILVDDTLTQGGTLAALRGYIENRGGKVLGVMVMSAKEHSLQLAPTLEILNNIQAKHGDAINDYWKKEFGYGIEQLTHSEAIQLFTAPDVNTIRDRITQARFTGSIGVGESGTTTQSHVDSTFAVILSALQAINPEAILKTEKPTTPCRGRVVFEGEDFVVQQVADGSRYFQKHLKADLSRVPALGEKVNISYASHEKLARVRSMGLRR